MKEETHLQKSIDSISQGKAMYDANAKELLADVQVLSRILKYTMSEFSEMDINDIIQCIDTDDIQIAEVPVDAGLTNLGKPSLAGTEDSIPNEGYIRYDIRFSVRIATSKVKILVNVEAQKKIEHLKYHIGNRMVYYLSRMISAEKETEFFHDSYDDIKKVVSIWICMSEEVEDGSIETLKLIPEVKYGANSGILNIDLMEGILIRIRSKENVSESKNKLISMLEVLLGDKTAEQKKHDLVEVYDMILTQELEGGINNMCNLSDVVEERGIEKGKEEGKIITLIKSIKSLMDNMQLSFEQACKALQLSEEDVNLIKPKM